MCLNVKITRYTIMQDAISVHVICPESNNEAIHGLIADKTPKMLHFRGLDVTGTIGAINISKNGVSILLKLPKEGYVAKRLWFLGMMETIDLTIEGEMERRLSSLIKSVAAETGKKEEELLYELSTFTNKENRTVEGKRSVGELSPKAQEVIIHKLNKIKTGEN